MKIDRRFRPTRETPWQISLLHAMLPADTAAGAQDARDSGASRAADGALGTHERLLRGLT